MDPIVYAVRYVEDAAAQGLIESKACLRLKERMKLFLIVVCKAGVEWFIDDGVRLMPQDRERLLCDSK